MRRSDGINLAKPPDPTILVKGLTSIVQGSSCRKSSSKLANVVGHGPELQVGGGLSRSERPPPRKVRELRVDQGRQDAMAN